VQTLATAVGEGLRAGMDGKAAAGSHACPACGEANDADAKFCKSCGKPLTKTCSACREVNDADATFCDSCGSRLS
jgi:rRNA maturation endonuclease Nob1